MTRTPQAWAQYIREAHQDSVAAIIETGRRLKEAHEAYKTKPRAWGQRWADWCRRELGLTDKSVSQYEILSENLSNAVRDFPRLPSSWGTLYQLAVLRRDNPDVFDQRVADGTITPEMTRARVEELDAGTRRDERQERDRLTAAAEDRIRASGVNWWVEQNDLRQWSIPDEAGKAKLVLCDPPYALEYLDLYAALPKLANEWLGETGWCAVMTGQRNLPQFLEALASGPLDYVWTIALTSSASRANGMQFLKMQNTWKPLIILRKGAIKFEEWTSDVISYSWEPSARVVQLHRWQQDVSPFQKFIRAVTKPDDLVVDPFCGAGTTGIAALSSGRHFAGCDIEAASVTTTITRLQTEERLGREAATITESESLPA